LSRLFTDSRDYGRRDGPLTVATAAGTGGSVASPHDGHRDQSYGTVAHTAQWPWRSTTSIGQSPSIAAIVKTTTTTMTDNQLASVTVEAAEDIKTSVPARHERDNDEAHSASFTAHKRQEAQLSPRDRAMRRVN